MRIEAAFYRSQLRPCGNFVSAAGGRPYRPCQGHIQEKANIPIGRVSPHLHRWAHSRDLRHDLPPATRVGKWIDRNGDGRYNGFLIEARQRAIRTLGPERYADEWRWTRVRRALFLDQNNLNISMGDHDRQLASAALDGDRIVAARNRGAGRTIASKAKPGSQSTSSLTPQRWRHNEADGAQPRPDLRYFNPMKQ
jgi:hypothetical protein